MLIPVAVEGAGPCVVSSLECKIDTVTLVSRGVL